LQKVTKIITAFTMHSNSSLLMMIQDNLFFRKSKTNQSMTFG